MAKADAVLKDRYVGGQRMAPRSKKARDEALARIRNHGAKVRQFEDGSAIVRRGGKRVMSFGGDDDYDVDVIVGRNPRVGVNKSPLRPRALRKRALSQHRTSRRRFA